jgi:hypothetical protein
MRQEQELAKVGQPLRRYVALLGARSAKPLQGTARRKCEKMHEDAAWGGVMAAECRYICCSLNWCTDAAAAAAAVQIVICRAFGCWLK